MNDGVLVDFPDETGDDFAGAEFEEISVAHGDESLDRIGPADGAGDLVCEHRADFRGIGHGGGGKIADNGDIGFLEGEGGKFRGELVLGGLHEARVVGTGDVEFDGAADAEFLGLGDCGIDSGDGAGEHDLAGRVKIGDIHIGGCGESADLVFLAADEGGHGAFGGETGLFHESAAFADDFEAVFEREGTGGGVGSELAERESGGGDGVEVRQAFADHGEGHQSVEVEGGLAARGFGEFLIRAFEHDLRNRETEGFVGFAGHFAAGGGFFREVFAHAHFLGTLSGEE